MLTLCTCIRKMISSLQNEKVKNWLKLRQKKYRIQEQKFIVEEEHLIQEALKANCLECIIALEDCVQQYDVEYIIVSTSVMKKLSYNTSLNRQIAICRFPKKKMTKQKLILLDHIQNPSNLGSIIRSAYSFGYDVIMDSCVDVYNEKCIAASQGAIFHIGLTTQDLYSKIKQLKDENYVVYATSLESECYLSTMPKPSKVALIMGNEGNGVRKEIQELATYQIKIEMNTFDSLNVAIASSICMYYFQ